MINTVFEILFFVYIPFLLVLVLIIRKQEKKDIGFYWGYRKQKNIKLRYDRSIDFSWWNISILTILFITLFYMILAQLGFFDINKIISTLPISRGQEIVVADLAAVSAFSLVMAVKKDFYLGISIQDVLKNTFLANILQYIGIDSVIIIIGIVVYRVDQITAEAKLLLLATVKITYILWICNLLYLFYSIAMIFVSTTKSELKAFNVLRYRLNGCYRLENRNVVDEAQLSAVCEYLFKRIQKCYTKLVGRDGEICKAEVQSIEIAKNTWINVSATVCFGVIAALFIVMGWLIQLNENTIIPIWLAGILSGITVVAIIVGYIKKIWIQGVFDKFFYEFDQKSKKKIAIKGANYIWNRRYDFIGNIQDSLGLYKVLLDNKMPKRLKKIFVKSINENIESQSIRNVIELLILYLEYENDLAKGKNKEVWTRYNRKIEIDSLEYTLSNAIISEVYKNVKCKDGIVDCMELKNVNFEQMVNCINENYVPDVEKIDLQIEINVRWAKK